MKKPNAKNSPEGLWFACGEVEKAAKPYLQKQLEPFEQIIRTCYEAGVQAPTLPGKRQNEPDLQYAALFLKKSLNDLRSVWILLRVGYTSQAASVAASLYENALTVVCLAGKPENVRKLKKQKTGDLPWSPQRLSKILADQFRDDAKLIGEKFSQKDYELAWRTKYAGYKWLCKIKHPTMGSAIHDAAVTLLEPGGYVVMAAPDMRPEDLKVKATIMTIVLNDVREAVRSFVLALGCDTTSQEFHENAERMQKVAEDANRVYKEIAKEPLPFIVEDQPFKDDFGKLLGIQD